MSATIQVERTETQVPLDLVVTRASGGVTGLTATVRIRDGNTTDSYLDFADSTFKTSGWTTQAAALTDVGNGFYALAGGLDLSAITNLPAATHYLSAEFLVSGGVNGSALTQILMSRDVYDLALALLQRSIADAESLPEFRSLGGAIQKLVNRVRINGSNLEVYESDDTTVSKTQALTTNANADPIVEADTA